MHDYDSHSATKWTHDYAVTHWQDETGHWTHYNFSKPMIHTLLTWALADIKTYATIHHSTEPLHHFFFVTFLLVSSNGIHKMLPVLYSCCLNFIDTNTSISSSKVEGLAFWNGICNFKRFVFWIVHYRLRNVTICLRRKICSRSFRLFHLHFIVHCRLLLTKDKTTVSVKMQTKRWKKVIILPNKGHHFTSVC